MLFDNPQLSLSLHDEVLARYSLVPWADTSTRSIFDTIATSESVTTKLESAVKMLDASMSSNMSSQYLNIPGISAPLVREHIQKYFHEPNAWWHTDVIDAVLEATESQTNHTPRGYLAFLHINFDSRGAPFHFVEDFTKGRRPWPCLPKDWLSQTTAGVISSRENTHFVAVAIFGPQKLVVVYDGREGSLDAPGLWSVRWRSQKQSPWNADYSPGVGSPSP